MRSTRRTVAIAMCWGASGALAQNIGTLRHHPSELYMRSSEGRASVLPQDELIAALPYDASSSFGARGQDFETVFDRFDIFLIEDIEPMHDARLGEFRSAGFGNGNPFKAKDVGVRIFENNGSGLPGENTYTGELVLVSTPGAGFFNGDTFEWITNFDQQCLPAGSYYLVFAARLDFGCCGATNFFVQAGEPSVGGGEPNNAWFWNPGEAWGRGVHFPVVDTISEQRSGISYLLFGNPVSCSCSNPDCPADLDGDGDTDADDFFAYLDLFATNDPCADIDQDGDADGDDFFAYLDLFVQGC